MTDDPDFWHDNRALFMTREEWQRECEESRRRNEKFRRERLAAQKDRDGTDD